MNKNTTILRAAGQLQARDGQRLLTAASIDPLVVLDMRRHANDYKNGQPIKSITALGHHKIGPQKFVSPQSESGAYAGTFQIEDGIPSLRLGGSKGSLTLEKRISIHPQPMTAVCVYKTTDWSETNAAFGRIYSMGATAAARMLLTSSKEQLFAWVGSTSGTGFYYDEPHYGWSVSVIQFNGNKSKIIDRNGGLIKANLSETGGISTFNLGGSAVDSSSFESNIAYFAAYSGEIEDNELLSLFADASNMFNIL